MTHQTVRPRPRPARRVVVTVLALAVLLGAAAVATPALAAPAVLTPALVMKLLDERAALGLPPEVADFGRDDTTGRVVVSLTGDRNARVDALLAGIDPGLLTVRTGAPAPRRQAALHGGDSIITGSKRCTAGFVATGGGRDWLLTAGHCTRGSGTWYAGVGGNWVAVGEGARTGPDRTDIGEIPISNTTDWQPRATIGGVTVTGSTVAAVGAPVCLYGSTSGRICGTITGRDRTVNFEGTTQYGMTSTSICSHEGDSGGPYLTASGQAQGIHSGGGTSGSCVSYFVPIAAALSTFGLQLRTG